MSNSRTSLNRCLICEKETAFNTGVHSCSTANPTNEITMNDLLARIERIEHNYRELLKVLQTGDSK